MDKEEAKKILAAHLARYRRLTYAELVRRLKTVVTCPQECYHRLS